MGPLIKHQIRYQANMSISLNELPKDAQIIKNYNNFLLIIFQLYTISLKKDKLLFYYLVLWYFAKFSKPGL